MAVSLRRPCRCGHEKDAHEHYRRGADCSGCRCVGYRGQLVLTIRFGKEPVPTVSVIVPDEVPPAYEPYVRPTHSGVSSAVLPVVLPRTEPEPSLEQLNAG